ncbi:hypothetical protein C7974DRAFT_401424 [Boeremia exigua]|uniref:uncharacterized protein n=1 Tax=Boeremia exigua TaxID=749465 RepID=UPI001E8CE439|nr:uncharacterized protein C7974DRAFT_401424 [Boeremia exigua]KAH6619058.1 hypothetical protein C7974DRAFT_401424 [Boeremia exigua]
MATQITPTISIPPAKPHGLSDVTAAERSSAIDFVNRNNFIMEQFQIDELLSQGTEDVTLRHWHGTINGTDEMRNFFSTTYPYIIPGVSRHATNHIVDRDEETGGVSVRYHQQCIRYAWPNVFKSQLKGKDSSFIEVDGGLPQTWIYNIMYDRLVMTKTGWKLRERVLGPAVVNPRMDPKNEPKP